MGRFTMQWRDGAWFIDAGGATQRVDGDGTWLDAWLVANGESTRDELDFGGNAALRQRFIHDLGPIAADQATNEPSQGKGRHRLSP